MMMYHPIDIGYAHGYLENMVINASITKPTLFLLPSYHSYYYYYYLHYRPY